MLTTVAPVVQDPLEHVDVGTSIEGTEQVARASLHPAAHPARTQEKIGLLEHLGGVDEDSPGPPTALEDRGQQGAVAAGHVADHPAARPRVGAREGRDVDRGELAHGLTEASAFCAVLAEVAPDRVTERPPVPRGIGPLAQQLPELAVGPRVGRGRLVGHPRGDRMGMIAVQRPAQARQAGPAVGVKADEAGTRCVAEHPDRHLGVESEILSELARMARTLAQGVGQTRADQRPGERGALHPGRVVPQRALSGKQEIGEIEGTASQPESSAHDSHRDGDKRQRHAGERITLAVRSRSRPSVAARRGWVRRPI